MERHQQLHRAAAIFAVVRLHGPMRIVDLPPHLEGTPHDCSEPTLYRYVRTLLEIGFIQFDGEEKLIAAALAPTESNNLTPAEDR